MVGETVRVVPLPTLPTPQLLLYHFQVAPVPRVPPTRVNVLLCPRQMVVLPLINKPGIEVSCTVTFTLRQTVLLQELSARTKYEVLVVGLMVMLLPVPIAVPAHEPLYHFQLAPKPRVPPFTLKVVEDPLHTVVVPVIDVAGLDVSRTVTTTDLHGEFLQVPSALTKYVVVAEGDTEMLLPEATDVPPHEPLYHLQVAPEAKLPPFVLSVVEVPRQMVLLPEMLTTGCEVSLTVSTTVLQMVLPQVASART